MGKIFVNDATNKRLIFKIYRQLIQINIKKKQRTKLKNEQKILDFYFQGFLSNPDIASQSECFRILSGQWANKLMLEKTFILLYYVNVKQQIGI